MKSYYGLQIGEHHDDPFFRQFMAARAYYVMARVALVEGFREPAVLLTEQTIELYLKAIRRKLGGIPKMKHGLVGLLEDALAPRPAYFDSLLTDPERRAFLERLTAAYAPARYGEVAWGINYGQVLAMLDEIAHNLDRVFRELEPRAGRLRYVPTVLRRQMFLENVHLGADEVTDNMVAIAGQED